MAVWNFKNTGIKAVAIPSIADDWTDSNCFPFDGGIISFQQVFNAATTGDEFIFDDDTHITSAQFNIGNGPGSALTITCKSRSGVAANCVLNTTLAINPIFAHNSTLYGHIFYFEDMTLTKSVVHTGTTGAIAAFTGIVEDTTYTRCIFLNVTTNSALASAFGMVFYTAAMAVGSRIITFNDCQFNNLSLSAFERPGVIAAVVDNQVILNNCTMNGCSIASTNGKVLGMFVDFGGGLINNGINVTDLTLTGDGINPINGGVFFQSAAGSIIVVDDAHINGVTITGSEGGCSAPLLHARISATLTNSSITNAINNVVGNSIGCLFLIGGTGMGTVTDSIAHNNRGFYGTGCYNTFSGTVICKRVKAYNNDGGAANIGFSATSIEGVDFYSGGSGDATYEYCESYSTNADSGAACSSVYILHNIADARTDRNKIVNITNCTFANPDTDLIPLMAMKMNVVGFSLTVNMTNTIIRGGLVDMHISNTLGNGNLDVNLTNCNYLTTDETEYNVGTVTEIDKIIGEPLFLSSRNLNLQFNSPCVGSAKVLPGMFGQETLDEPVPAYDNDVGARQSKHSPLHPYNL